MKKNPLLHPELSKVIASLGDGDRLVIGTADVSIDAQVKRVDLALTQKVPSVVQTLEVVMSELWIREVVIAEELEGSDQSYFSRLTAILGDIPTTQIMYVALQQQAKMAKAVVRTGDLTDYGMVILIAGKVDAIG